MRLTLRRTVYALDGQTLVPVARKPAGKAPNRAAKARSEGAIGSGSLDGGKTRQKAAFRLTRPEPTEAQIQASILQLLRRHPRVAWVGRINSGSAWLPGKDGRDRPVKFHDIEGCSDIIGQLRCGRFLAVEVKRPRWRKPSDEREQRQAAFLSRVREANGIALFARRIEDVIEALK